MIGHHAHTNIPGRDPDLYHAPRFWRFHRGQRHAPAHAWQAWTTPLLWLLSVPTLLLVKPLAALRAAAYNRAVPLVALPPWRVAAHLAGRAGVFASLYAWPWLAFPAAPGKAAAFALVPIAVYSVWFMACSQVNHHTPETSHSFSPHWYRHQAATALNVAPASALAFYLSGGLNLQIEHHLLPGVNHAHLRALQPLVAAAAARHGVPYAVAPTIAGAFARLWAHLGELAVRPPRGEGAGGGGGASAAGSSAAEGETGGAARRERRGAKLD